jgi:hypothetical protein
MRDKVRGDWGDRYERGPGVRVGKNKGGAVWDASPDLLRLLGNQVSFTYILGLFYLYIRSLGHSGLCHFLI